DAIMKARQCLRLALVVGGGWASLGALACGGDTGRTSGSLSGGVGGSSAATTTSSGTGMSPTTTGSVVTTGAGGARTGGVGGGGTTTGTGGAAMVDCTKDSGLVRDVIADFESGSGLINDAPGRHGSFYTYNDLTQGAVQSPPAGDASPAEIPGGR